MKFNMTETVTNKFFSHRKWREWNNLGDCDKRVKNGAIILNKKLDSKSEEQNK